ncbi:MAG: hypothetical protein CVT49_10975 [candidate division Zixibacteria bacterium HGW-Zixibacteria-1]|nr:MAG: hypothetical protein CVT49_10975 [candidate division Zixibacteria bacterium HGW-Zixibacteria-1]
MIRNAIYFTTALIIISAFSCFASGETKSDKMPSVGTFLTADGQFDLEAARQSGYQGSLDMEGFESAIDPATGQPLFHPASPADDPDDIYWDNNTSPSIPGVEDQVQAMAIYNGSIIIAGFLTVAGSVIVSNIASWNGTTWSTLGSGMNKSVYALTVYDNMLIAGGSFTMVGGVQPITSPPGTALPGHRLDRE